MAVGEGTLGCGIILLESDWEEKMITRSLFQLEGCKALPYRMCCAPFTIKNEATQNGARLDYTEWYDTTEMRSFSSAFQRVPSSVTTSLEGGEDSSEDCSPK